MFKEPGAVLHSDVPCIDVFLPRGRARRRGIHALIHWDKGRQGGSGFQFQVIQYLPRGRTQGRVGFRRKERKNNYATRWRHVYMDITPVYAGRHPLYNLMLEAGHLRGQIFGKNGSKRVGGLAFRTYGPGRESKRKPNGLEVRCSIN